MASTKTIGIYGLGVYLPEEVRKNDWWAPSVVDGWVQTDAQNKARVPSNAANNPGVKRVLEAMRESAQDPFRGSRERRIMDSNMRATDMEIAAAKDAVTRSGVDPSEIDLLLTYTVMPDYLATNTSCSVHLALGLAPSCLSLSVDGACNSFQLQLAVAQRMIAGGGIRHALLVQCSASTRLLPWGENYSPWFGDGATAVVVGPTKPGLGVLHHTHRTDGTYADGLVVGVPKAKWYDEGRPRVYWEDVMSAPRLLMGTANFAQEVIGDALKGADVRAEDVDFYGCHQGTSWLRRVTQEHVGLTKAKSVDTFHFAASLAGANLPLVLATAQRENMLSEGDLVVLFSGGSGITWSSTVLRWGV